MRLNEAGPVALVISLHAGQVSLRFGLITNIFINNSSDDVFKSTLHRVVNSSGSHRYSIPLFFNGDHNVKLEVSIWLFYEILSSSLQAIPSCVSETRPAKYDVVSVGEYLKSQYQAMYGGKSTSRQS